MEKAENQRFVLNREYCESEHNVHVSTLALYNDLDTAMGALRKLAEVLNASVEVRDSPFSDEPDCPIWTNVVTDHCGASYYLTLEQVDENGEIVDIFDF